jgi:hypothetical protein
MLIFGGRLLFAAANPATISHSMQQILDTLFGSQDHFSIKYLFGIKVRKINSSC